MFSGYEFGEFVPHIAADPRGKSFPEKKGPEFGKVCAALCKKKGRGKGHYNSFGKKPDLIIGKSE